MKLSKHTTTTEKICCSYLTEQERMCYDISVGDIIERTRHRFFDFDFPFYTDNQNVKEYFEKYFLSRYWNNYIGFETLGMWRTAFIAKMYELTPYYKKLYSAMENDNPFVNVDMLFSEDESSTENSKSISKDTVNSKTKSSTNYQNIDSDNPQVTIGTGDYASNMSRGENVGDSTNDTTGRTDRQNDSGTKRKKTRTEKGLNGKSKSEVIAEYRNQIQNINREIVDNCRDLFLKVW